MTHFAASIQAAAISARDDGADLFTQPTRDVLQSVCDRVARLLDWPVSLDFGATDDGAEHWAALSVDSLPPGAFGRPGLLVSVLVSHGPPGTAVVLAADGRTTLCTVPLADHMADWTRIAEAEAVQQFTALAEGACA